MLSAIGLVRPSRILGEMTDGCEVELIVSMFEGFFNQVESAAKIGQVYLERVPGETDSRFLVDRICSSLGNDWRNGFDLHPEELRMSIRQRIRIDFEEGRTVIVRGWILSETETRLCGLVALSRHRVEERLTKLGIYGINGD
jgi:hypothetical protein